MATNSSFESWRSPGHREKQFRITRRMQKFSIKKKIFCGKFILVEKKSSEFFGPKISGKSRKFSKSRFFGKIEKSEIFITGFQLKIFGFFDFRKFSRKNFWPKKNPRKNSDFIEFFLFVALYKSVSPYVQATSNSQNYYIRIKLS